jgi:hypothetical protein
MSAAKSARHRVVVDGSNLATEGRTIPSLVQLDEAVRSFLEENPASEVIVVVDASFEHRVAPAERARFKEAELAGEIVTPPAGAIGRGDAFILKIAQRINAVVLSNDSFQEFHDEYPWLFDVDRLVGGKPVKGVGWVFTPRIPVRGIKTSRPVKKLTVTLSDGAKPTIGTTLTPVKSQKVPVKKAAAKATKPPTKAAKKVAKPVEIVTKPIEAPVKKASKRSAAVKKAAPVKAAARSVRKAAKAPAPLVEKVLVQETPAPAPALRRGRQPVNPEAEFDSFKHSFKIGAKVEGEVAAFTSHGAIITVKLKSGKHVECYAPTTSLGDPAPARARDVLKRGDIKVFQLITVDSERRIAELGLA